MEPSPPTPFAAATIPLAPPRRRPELAPVAAGNPAAAQDRRRLKAPPRAALSHVGGTLEDKRPGAAAASVARARPAASAGDGGREEEPEPVGQSHRSPLQLDLQREGGSRGGMDGDGSALCSRGVVARAAMASTSKTTATAMTAPFVGSR